MAASMAGEAILDSLNSSSSTSTVSHHPSASLSDDQLSMLYFLFSKNLERALRILDQKGVYRIVGEPSKRVTFQVTGESKGNDKYLCFPRHFCSCHSFFFDVVGRGEQLCCKHQLAARIGDALGICQQVTLSDEELAVLLLQ